MGATEWPDAELSAEATPVAVDVETAGREERAAVSSDVEPSDRHAVQSTKGVVRNRVTSACMGSVRSHSHCLEEGC